MKIKIIIFVFLCSVLFGETYTRVYNPTASVDTFSVDDVLGEYNEIGRILNGFLDDVNFSNGELLSIDIMDNSITGAKIKDDELVPGDLNGFGSIARGSFIYADATSNLAEFVVGSSGEYLMSNGEIPVWGSSPDLPFTDDTGVVYATSADDNLAVGGVSSSNGKAVLELYNNAIPTTSPANGVQIFSKDVGDTNVKLLMNFEGSDGSTKFTDSSLTPHTFSIAGTAQIDNAQYKYGSTSMVLNGTNSYIYTSDSADWFLSTGDFTIAAWVRTTSLTKQQTICSHYTNSSNYWRFIIDNTNGALQFRQIISGVTNIIIQSKATNMSLNEWHYIEICKASNVYYMFYDGDLINTDTDTYPISNFTSNFLIGSLLGTVDFFSGWIDDFYFIKGTALHTSSYTVPSAQTSLPVYAELFVRDEAGNSTQKSPHDLNMIPKERLLSYFFPFSFTSKNEFIGLGIAVDMVGFIEEVEKLSGKQFEFKKEL